MFETDKWYKKNKNALKKKKKEHSQQFTPNINLVS